MRITETTLYVIAAGGFVIAVMLGYLLGYGRGFDVGRRLRDDMDGP